MTACHTLKRPGYALLATAVIAGVLLTPGNLLIDAHAAQASRPDSSVGHEHGARVVLPTGRPLVLFLFATWCKYSVYEARYVVPRFAGYVARRHARIVGVDETDLLGVGRAGPPGHPDRGESRPQRPGSRDRDAAARIAIAAYRRASGLSIPLIADPTMTLKRHLALYFNGAYPTFVFITARGRVVMRAEGAQPYAALASTFDDAATLR